jgi:hypothetical protein
MMLNRADLTALGWRRIEAEVDIKLHQRSRLPWLQHLQLSYGSGSGTSTGEDITSNLGEYSESDFRDDSSDDEEWAITTAINIPLFGSANNELKQLKIKLQQSETTEQAKIKSAKMELRDFCISVRKQAEMLRQYKKHSLPIISEIKTALKNKNISSNLSFEEKIKMYEDLAVAKELIMELDFNYRIALINLDKAIGIPLFHVKQ